MLSISSPGNCSAFNPFEGFKAMNKAAGKIKNRLAISPPATILRQLSFSFEGQQAHDKLTSFADGAIGDNLIHKREDGAMVGPFPSFISAASKAGLYSLNGKHDKIPGLSLEARQTAILAVGCRYKAAYELYAHSKVAEETKQ